MSEDEKMLEAQNIVDDISDEHGEFAPFGSITLDEARDTVESYGYEGNDLEDIAKLIVSLMGGLL